MTRDTWDQIAAAIPGSANEVAEIRRQLANHVWCDLIVGFVRVIEESQQAIQELPAAAKEMVKRTISQSSLQGSRSRISDHVIDLLVDRVWTAFMTVAVANVPLLAILTSDDTLRSLLILAVFICPAPERHQEVRTHALDPLGKDVREVLTEQTKLKLRDAFDYGGS